MLHMNGLDRHQIKNAAIENANYSDYALHGHILSFIATFSLSLTSAIFLELRGRPLY